MMDWAKLIAHIEARSRERAKEASELLKVGQDIEAAVLLGAAQAERDLVEAIQVSRKRTVNAR